MLGLSEMIGGIFSGTVISIEHLVMVVLGGAGASVLSSKITKLRIQINGRLSETEARISELEDRLRPVDATPEQLPSSD